EAGVRLGSISLAASQPWPIGRGGSCELMLACRAVALSEDLAVNREEIEDA
ncbi:NUDT19, partial [Symbiodinium pilosum]